MRISYWSSDLCSSDLLCQVGKLAVIGAEDRRVELELLGGIGDPAFAEALPRQRRGRTGAEHRPHRHFQAAGVHARKDADAVGVGQLQHVAHPVADMGEERLACRTGRAAWWERGFKSV